MKKWTNKEVMQLMLMLRNRWSIVVMADCLDRSYESVRMYIRKLKGKHK